MGYVISWIASEWDVPIVAMTSYNHGLLVTPLLGIVSQPIKRKGNYTRQRYSNNNKC